MFCIFVLYPKFSVFRFGCALVGGFFLLEKLHVITAVLNSGIIIAAIILLFGISLLVDTLRKRSRPRFQDKFCNAHHGKMIRDYSVDGDHFIYDASFGSDRQAVQLDKLRCGEISVNFGDYAVDMTAVASLEEKCTVCADCSFGEMTILIPRRFTVIPDSSTTFASLDVQGHPDASSDGTIHVNADVSFGEIRIQYI